MHLEASDVSGTRVALWAASGEPITTITIPIVKAKLDFGSLERASYELNGVKFSVDTGRNRFGGITFGDQLILDTQEKRPEQIGILVAAARSPVAIEVIAQPAQGVDTEKAVTLSREGLKALEKEARITSRNKMGHTVHTLTYDDPQKALARLQAFVPRFAIPPQPRRAPDAIQYAFSMIDDVFTSLDKARALSKETGRDVYFKLHGREAYIPHGKTATVTVSGTAFDLAPGQPARKAYEAVTQRPVRTVRAPDAIEYDFSLLDDVFTSLDKARALSNETGKDVYFRLHGREAYISHGKTATVTVSGTAFDLAPKETAREAYEATQQRLSGSGTKDEVKRILDSDQKRPGQRELKSGDTLPG